MSDMTFAMPSRFVGCCRRRRSTTACSSCRAALSASAGVPSTRLVSPWFGLVTSSCFSTRPERDHRHQGGVPDQSLESCLIAPRSAWRA